MHRRWTQAGLISKAVALGVALAAVVGASLVTGPSLSQAAPSTRPYALTLGDSYSIGYQPGTGGTPGYAGYISRRLKMQVANVGCGGATTSSLLHSVGCGDPASQDAVPYPVPPKNRRP